MNCEREESRMTPRFLARIHGRTKLPFTEKVKTMGGTNLGGRLEACFGDMLNF